MHESCDDDPHMARPKGGRGEEETYKWSIDFEDAGLLHHLEAGNFLVQ